MALYFLYLPFPDDGSSFLYSGFFGDGDSFKGGNSGERDLYRDLYIEIDPDSITRCCDISGDSGTGCPRVSIFIRTLILTFEAYLFYLCAFGPFPFVLTTLYFNWLTDYTLFFCALRKHLLEQCLVGR